MIAITSQDRRWDGQTVFVAATGPSLTPAVADLLHGHRIVAVNDAYRLLPFADVLYACDASWWIAHKGCPNFAGERWSSHQKGGSNDKALLAGSAFDLHYVAGRAGDQFRTDGVIAYGGNSGFQAINLAILFGAARVVLVGFDMREIGGKKHFFGDHKKPLRNGNCFRVWIEKFKVAAKHIPEGVEIVNATEGSALRCFPAVSLKEIVCHAE